MICSAFAICWAHGASWQPSIITIDANDAVLRGFTDTLYLDEHNAMGFREKPVVSPVHHPLVTASLMRRFFLPGKNL
ncbi:hypothetical protein [Pseudomonas sp. URMO17WK12:I4]|uniref:hypothetical protein n=1 Tax=Pseudomonas sp. URMO17WK12:I4 TaxID=1283292 RepID=UPI0004885048|nr:hypothetical protein [Pseudomonas sp. URMO17WK12:I4]